MTWEQTARELERYIKDTVDELFGDFQDVSDEIFEAVNDIVDRLDVKDGKIRNTQKNLNIIATNLDRIVRILRASDYSERIDEFINRFGPLIDFNVEIQEDLNGIKPKTFLNQNKTIRTLKNDIGNQFDVPFVQGEIVTPISQLITGAVLGGTSVYLLRRALKKEIAGTEDNVNILKRKIGTQAMDSMYQSNGTINKELAIEYDFNAWRYIGSLITTSRPQCIRWVEKFQGLLPFDIMASEIRWAYRNGSGMIPNTTQDNFQILRGGYNCLHLALATWINQNNN